MNYHQPVNYGKVRQPDTDTKGTITRWSSAGPVWIVEPLHKCDVSHQKSCQIMEGR